MIRGYPGRARVFHRQGEGFAPLHASPWLPGHDVPPGGADRDWAAPRIRSPA